MKIGILTLPLHTNYGGILQAYALQTVLERMGHEVSFITLKVKSERYGLIKRIVLYIIRSFKTTIVPDTYSKNSSKYTEKFIRKWIKRDEYYSLNEITESKYDAIIVGSDQIWRALYVKMCHMSIENCFLDFTEGWNIKRIAYAASFGTDCWDFSADETLNISKLAQNFNNIGVRKSSGVDMCLRHLGCKVVHVLDPTMLLNRQDYLKLIPIVRKNSRGIMTYILDYDEQKDTIVETIKDMLNKEVFASNIPNINSCSKRGRIQPPVEQWLSGFEEAEFVVTDSFHACVFSIIFNKPFIAIVNYERGMARFKSLLNMINQEYRMITSLSSFSFSPMISDAPNCNIDQIKSLSFDFLRNSL